MLRALVEPEPADYTVAVDDCLLQRWQHCSLCGRRPAVLDQVLARHDRLGIAVLYCLRCLATDPHRDAMRALLESRYGAL
jgi:hypothetical protein